MITHELVEKINALWHKQKSVGLTDEEKEEQRLARQEYLAGIKGQMRDMLDALKKPDSVHNQDDSGCSCDKCSKH